MISLLRNNKRETTAVGIGVALAILHLDPNTRELNTHLLNKINHVNILDQDSAEDVIQRVINQKQKGLSTWDGTLSLYKDYLTKEIIEAMDNEYDLINSVRVYVSNILAKG